MKRCTSFILKQKRISSEQLWELWSFDIKFSALVLGLLKIHVIQARDLLDICSLASQIFCRTQYG